MTTYRCRIILLFVAAIALAALVGVRAQDSPASKTEWTVEDILLEEGASQFDLSPDGQWAVWVRKAMDKEKGEEVSNLVLSSLTRAEEIVLTRGPYANSLPTWSPDGTLISFLSSRPLPRKQKDDGDAPEEDLAKTQLWLINPRGGEPWHLTEFKRGVKDYGWKDKDSIAFAAQEDPSLYEETIKKRKDTSQVVEDAGHEPPVRLFVLSVKDKKVTRVTANVDWIDRVEVSPDGRWAVSRHQRSLSFEFDHKTPPNIFLTDLETGAVTPVVAGQRLNPQRMFWERGSQGFYFTTAYSSDPHYFTATITLLYHYDLRSRRLRAVDLDWENGLAEGSGSLEVTADGFIALLADGARHRPARYLKRTEGWERQDMSGDHAKNVFDWKLSRDGRVLVYDHSTTSKPTQWYRATLEDARVIAPQQLTHLNPSFDNKPSARTEIIRWTGARGDTVEGVLHYPIDYQEGRRYPLMLVIHGGPSGYDMDWWDISTSDPIPLLTQRNAFVLRPNYHGSGNYGLAWVESICCGNYYDLERVDLENGVDYLIERGLADPERLGTMGWSNGAILTTELVTRNRRYKVASAGAGDVEWISDWGNVDFGASFDNYYFGAAPYEDPERYIRKSPYFRLQDVTTPTIIYTGTDDRNVPPSQSWSHYRVLQQATQTPVKFILFPGEPHGLRKYVHRRRKLEEDMAWFDQHLFGTYKEPNEAFKEGSPLDVALKAQRVSRVGTRYGVDFKGTLVPEVVEHNGLGLGRFEVTRAQFAAFDRTYRYDPGTENYPASGIRFEQAKAYTGWLSKLSGEAYRLPNENEARTLYETAGKSENTLDYWAGYTPNPDDAKRLQQKLAEMTGSAPLLRPVGMFQGRGKEELVFDLGGNVAEWAVAADGSGKLLGGSADQPADTKAHSQQAAEAYRGFRVVRPPK